ncbi:hypothetical protein GCM10022197_34490 [Microlunatus spumicola]|uniref:Uncharacterized protein n=1 Tax=Microlunatus spumicola TaxID=81499 RepID=A0ABP6Y036_9ACTN
MSRPLSLVSLVLAGLLPVLLVGAPASASPRSPDPEVTQAPARSADRSAAKVAPATVDSDVYVYTTTASSRTSFLVAGHLTLTLKSGSMTSYKGSLVDYNGQKSYKASADTTDVSAPVLKLEGKNGKFTITTSSSFGGTYYSGTATSKPSKVKLPLSSIALSASAHSTHTATYSFILSERTGALNNPVEYVGTLTMAYDANGRISGGQVTVTNAKGKVVTNALKSSGYYGGGSFYTVAKVDKKHFGLSATLSGSSFSGYGFGADGSKTTMWVLSGTV